MTSGIRKNWMEAIESIIGNVRRAEEKSARQDMGFVFEPPMRSPRVTSSPAASPLPQLAPVVPNSGSRINSALRYYWPLFVSIKYEYACTARLQKLIVFICVGYYVLGVARNRLYSFSFLSASLCIALTYCLYPGLVITP